MSNERWQGEELFKYKSHALEMPPFHAKMRLKGAPQKLNFLMAKSIQESYTVNCSHKCSCTFSHIYTLLHRLVFEKNHFM